jgi:hypothetical protein
MDEKLRSSASKIEQALRSCGVFLAYNGLNQVNCFHVDSHLNANLGHA